MVKSYLTVTNHVFGFDRVHDQADNQEVVYLSTGRPATKAVLAGYNSTILAYGQTGTGKTHTMEVGYVEIVSEPHPLTAETRTGVSLSG